MSFSVIVLAAGSSSRLGRPKQLLVYQGETLVERALRTAVDSRAQEVILVLGAYAEQIMPLCSPQERGRHQGSAHERPTPTDEAGTSIRAVVNPDWALGLATSIHAGLDALSPDADSVVITLCDQPHVTSGHIRALADKLAGTGAEVVPTAYGDTRGVPAAFARAAFPRLRALQGDQGARDLIRAAVNPPTAPFEAAQFDIDTESDLEALHKPPVPSVPSLSFGPNADR